MELDFTKIYNSLNFLSESLRLQYTNFIWRNQNRFNEYLSFDDAIYRLRLGEPIEYVFNLAEFCGLKLYVDKRSLIPRPETEKIVDLALQFIEENPERLYTIIDVGTGSGCIALAIAHTIRNRDLKVRSICGIDISNDALEVARINRKALSLGAEVSLINTPFQDFDFSQFENLVICSNLPYIPAGEELQDSVINYEPHLALFGGVRGDELNNELLTKLKHLDNVSSIFMEGYDGEVKRIIPL